MNPQPSANQDFAPRTSDLSPPATATAVIGRYKLSGEIFYRAAIRLNTTRCRSIRFEDRPSALAVCLDVLEWAQRHGKQLHWQYLDLNL
jgi:hypothetical protein